jgi:uncharacterized damage-inducible protein DinB
MLDLLRDLMAHKAYADAAVLRAIRQNEAAASDAEVCDLVRHILLANRYWLLSTTGQPFVYEEESLPGASLDALIARYRLTHEQERAWLATATEADAARLLEHARIPGGPRTVGQALTQVCLHSQGHRAQCAKLLRRHGGVPPTTDYILWVATRPSPDWDELPGRSC